MAREPEHPIRLYEEIMKRIEQKLDNNIEETKELRKVVIEHAAVLTNGIQDRITKIEKTQEDHHREVKEVRKTVALTIGGGVLTLFATQIITRLF
tara:strand:- start:1259 stop:1543 length:285 start_codon:yes stop_codon:yes gene_type:complete